MNITRENREGQVAVIKVTVGEADYNEAVDKKLREYRRKANVPGFRPGMVPMSLINKMYRKGVVAETAYKTASDAVFEYIDKEKIDYVGDVLPSDEQGAFDFENNTEHEFVFEIGLAPEVEVELSDKDKLTRYKIKVSDEMRSGFRSNFLRRYGRLVDVEEVTSDEAITGTLDNGDTATQVVPDSQWTTIFVPLEYAGAYPDYTHLSIICSSSSQGDAFKGTAGSTMKLDNMRLVYEE